MATTGMLETSMLTSNGRGMGALLQPEDYRDYDAGVLFDESDLPESVDLTDHLPGIFDQGSTNSCVGWAVCTASYVRAKAAGLQNVYYPSPMALYALGRARLTGSPKVPLVDRGSQPRSVLAAAATWGLIPETAYGFDPAKINQRPTWRAIDAGVGFRLKEYYWVLTHGHARVLDAKRALANGYPVIMSVAVDPSFEDHMTIAIGKPTTQIRGYHMITLVGYRPGTSGTVFQVANSWGTGWGSNGLGWLSEERLTDLTTNSIAVIQTVPGEK